MARPNGVRELWQAGKPVINSWLGIPSSFSAEVMANAGWDSLVVDMQHGMIDYQMMVTMLQGISTTNTTPLVRVPWNDPAHIQKALDAGAYGIICPMINNRAEAEKFVGSCRYAPLGYRSSGPIRASFYGGSDYHPPVFGAAYGANAAPPGALTYAGVCWLIPTHTSQGTHWEEVCR